MRLKQIRGLPVIDPSAARKIGVVTDYQIDPASGRLAALDITTTQGGEAERILAQRVRRIGSSAIILTARGGSMPGTQPDINERWLDSSTLVGLEVMGDDGNRIGQLVDATFDQDSLEVETYLLNGSFWERLFGRRNRVEPSKVHSCSRELMMVTTGHLKETAIAPEETAPLDVRMPLKDVDRLPTPTFEPVADGNPVAAESR
jgi:sporulation protein YlmC with PRC-barrel domain